MNLPEKRVYAAVLKRALDRYREDEPEGSIGYDPSDRLLVEWAEALYREVAAELTA